MANVTTEEKEDLLNEENPTREDIFAAALLVAKKTNLVPTLLGPTASGKTFGLQQLSEENNAEVVTVLLGQHTPDEIAGFQLALNNELVIQMPFWFKEAQNILNKGKNAWILFDELGLSREETRGALYTFMRDRHLHGHRLDTGKIRNVKTEVLVFAASNPATFAPPFKSRCLFLSVPSDRDYLKKIASSSDFVTKIAKLAPISDNSDPFYSNDAPPAPVVINAAAIKALVDITYASEFWRLNEPARYAILSGLVPRQTLTAVLKDTTINLTALLNSPDEIKVILAALPTDKRHSMITNLLSGFSQVDKNIRADAIITILDTIYDDITGNDIEIYFSTPHDEDVITSISEIDLEYLVKRLAERNIFKVTVVKNQHVVSGTIKDRLEKLIEATEKDAE